jgi:hypothetical protein
LEAPPHARRPRLELLPPADLAPHERTIPARVASLLQAILAARAVYKPIIADEATLTVIDGHHRLHALMLLGARRVPVLLVDYERDAARIDPAPKPAMPSLLARLSPTRGTAAAVISNGGTRVLPVDPLGAYEALARSPDPQAAGPGPHGATITLPPPEPWVVRELAARRLLLPPQTTIHRTWAKAILAPVPLRLLLHL